MLLYLFFFEKSTLKLYDSNTSCDPAELANLDVGKSKLYPITKPLSTLMPAMKTTAPSIL